MVVKIISSTVVALALGAGVAYAATQLASSDGTDVCVNQTNGLMRASSTCRDGEYAMTIGGGSDVVVTQKGTFTLALGESDTPMALPLTGVSISGLCEPIPPAPFPPMGLEAKILISAPTGTMDAISELGGTGTIGGTSLTSRIVGTTMSGLVAYGAGSTIVAANDATATISYGAQVSEPDKTCKIIWQATEAPN